MKARIGFTIMVALLTGPAWATNGDNLIGVGPVNRALGGAGVAAPQDSITAIFNNPAAMGNCPCGKESETIFGATLFDPTVNGSIRMPNGFTYKGTSQHDVFVIPSLGITTPINDQLRFGFGAYGVSGLGTDYRNMGWDLDGNPANGFEGDLYTRLEIMKFAPMLSYEIDPNLSVGISLNGSYNNLDLGSGGSHDYAYGAQLGGLWKGDGVAVGVSYTSPQKATFERVYNFDAFTGDTTMDTLSLEAPSTYTAGIAVEPTPQWMVEFDAKYLDWANAEGYKDFDWNSQWVFAVGSQYKVNDTWTARVGYNYGENPVENHDGFNPMGVTTVQGKQVPTLGYELLRNVGFPAVVESHLTLGLGWNVTEVFAMNFSYMHAFEKTTTTTSAGGFFELGSSLEEDSLSMSMAWKF